MLDVEYYGLVVSLQILEFGFDILDFDHCKVESIFQNLDCKLENLEFGF